MSITLWHHGFFCPMAVIGKYSHSTAEASGFHHRMAVIWLFFTRDLWYLLLWAPGMRSPVQGHWEPPSLWMWWLYPCMLCQSSHLLQCGWCTWLPIWGWSPFQQRVVWRVSWGPSPVTHPSSGRPSLLESCRLASLVRQSLIPILARKALMV